MVSGKSSKYDELTKTGVPPSSLDMSSARPASYTLLKCSVVLTQLSGCRDLHSRQLAIRRRSR